MGRSSKDSRSKELSRVVGGCRLFEQPMVPVVSAEDGQWLLPEPLRPLMKPGGHGAIWKLMLDEGVFSWLSNRRREAAIVRQIRSAAPSVITVAAHLHHLPNVAATFMHRYLVPEKARTEQYAFSHRVARPGLVK